MMEANNTTGRPNVLVFDLGKVLVDFDYGIAVQRIVERSRVDHEEIHRVINQSPLLIQYETGAMTSPEFFEAVRAATGFEGDYEEFGAFFGDIFSEIPLMTSLNRRLRAVGVRTYILSNTNELAIRHIRATFPFFAEFDGTILSYEHGSMKPDPRLYDVVEQTCGERRDGIVFLDDRAENVEAAVERGWLGRVHQSPERSIAEIESLFESALMGSGASPAGSSTCGPV